MGVFMRDVINGLKKRERRYNARMSKDEAAQVKKDLTQQLNNDQIEFIEWASKFMDDICMAVEITLAR
jgi:hypothetical protein